MRVGIEILPERRWADAEHHWRSAEAYGFDHAWTVDHLGWRTLLDSPWFDGMATLTAAAMATSRIRLGLLVASPHFRHPVPFARQLLSLDDISAGRFTLGIGAGGGGTGGYDATVLGRDELSPSRPAIGSTNSSASLPAASAAAVPDRGERAESDAGRPAARPGLGDHRLPVGVGVHHGRVLAGGHRHRRPLPGARRDRRRQPVGDRSVPDPDAAPIYPLTSVESFRDTLGRAAELGFTDVTVPWPRQDGIYVGDESMLDRVAAEVLPGLSTG